MPRLDEQQTTPAVPPIPVEHQIGDDHMVRALSAIADKNWAVANAAAAEERLGRFEELSMLPPGYRVIKRIGQERALRKWLKAQDYQGVSDEVAGAQLRDSAQLAQNTSESYSDSLAVHVLPRVRLAFAGVDETGQKYADAFLRAYDAPQGLVEACDAAAAASGQKPNLLTWLSHGATDEQLEKMLLWNAEHTQRVAENPERVRRLVAEAQERVQASVVAGALGLAWESATPQISKIVIRDILGVAFIGSAAGSERAKYDAPTGVLTISPYELPETAPLEHVAAHEVGHAYGGFASRWLAEMGADMFANITQGKDALAPTGGYDAFKEVMRTFMDEAGISPRQVMDCFLGSDWEANEARLADLFREACGGADVLGVAIKFANEAAIAVITNREIPEHEWLDAAYAAATQVIGVWRQTRKAA